jgi:hypothetical protein
MDRRSTDRARYLGDMSGGASSDPALDDWFDEPQPRAESRGQTAPAADNWLDGGGETGREWRAGLAVRGFGSRRRLVAAGATAVVLLLLLGLAVAGVFSGGTSTSAPTATRAATTASTSTTESTAVANPASTAGPTTTLKPGATGVQVRALQRALAHLGYSPGKIDGRFGPATEKALATFQGASKLSPDGILGAKSLAALRKALRKGG